MPPMPPPDMRFNVAGIRDEEQFDASGRRSVLDFQNALAGIGRRMSEFPRILEWGCGCGRILRHVTFDPTHQEVHGCDIDRQATDWLQGAIPALKVISNGGLPPLPYPDGHFDLIINHSVLTHLDEAYQDAWLAELRRILAPEGVLILTVHGPHAYDLWAATAPTGDPAMAAMLADSRRGLERDGIYFLADNGWSAHFPAFYQSTFHTPSYVFEHWGRSFDIRSYIPRGSLGHQDMIVMGHRRPAVQSAPNLAEAHTAELRRQIDELHNSTSWRITAPLRSLARRLRGG